MKTVKAAILVALLITVLVLEYRNLKYHRIKDNESAVQLEQKRTNEFLQRKDNVHIIPQRIFVDSVDKEKRRKRQPHVRGIAKVLHIAKKMRVNPLLVTVVDNTRLPFALNWLCNTKDMDVHKQVLMIAIDRDTKQKIQNIWPKIHIAVIAERFRKSNHSNIHEEYAKLANFRARVVLELLLLKQQILQFQVNAIWLKNPLPILSKFSRYDILTNQVYKKPKKIAIGFLYLFPKQATISVYKDLNRKLHQLHRKRRAINPGKQISPKDYEQKYFSTLVRKHFLRKKELAFKYFADGKWYYRLPERKRTSLKPYVINWIIRNKNNIKRVEKLGHWFLNEGNSCNEDQVRIII